ncbi:hypothetical protein PPL_08507 [Heterostelium album PN500]|uniref:Uncharacterized protein n=1 Tax=Heterostelium pallidum (strain ATCC 26659 / Pp 5 / PN500) TaxID=670386 RepID=D3BID7_HETP5|nr:hypothetical protein PPL_08507 [Heterostelium album PN500]EFA79037.1 hypothetical protein PPL_08507 [Heterostelium album PN500]|eukprot:XP_020431160.1 hypothetical protein PPL_08507 [Heterostelium album PN500]
MDSNSVKSLTVPPEMIRKVLSEKCRSLTNFCFKYNKNRWLSMFERFMIIIISFLVIPDNFNGSIVTYDCLISFYATTKKAFRFIFQSTINKNSSQQSNRVKVNIGEFEFVILKKILPITYVLLSNSLFVNSNNNNNSNINNKNNFTYSNNNNNINYNNNNNNNNYYNNSFFNLNNPFISYLESQDMEIEYLSQQILLLNQQTLQMRPTNQQQQYQHQQQQQLKLQQLQPQNNNDRSNF